MGKTNSCKVYMINFANKDYLGLLMDIFDYFDAKTKYPKGLGYDDTVIRYDQQSKKYIASVYVLDDIIELA